MEHIRIKIAIWLVFLLVFLISCSKDSNGLEGVFTDQAMTIEENPVQGTIIGKVKENLQGNYAFTIVEQSPNGALEINAATGELYVADKLLFDFEVYPELTATVKIANTEGSTSVNITVKLEDLDDIVFFLEASRQSYLEADYGDWILITEQEYNLLAERITGVVKSGTNDAEYALESTTFFELLNITFGNYNAHNIPENHRLFAFKYYATEENTEEVYIKISLTDVSPAYVSLPTVLPPHGKGDQFFVLKGGSDPAIRELRLGMYSPKGGLVVVEPELDSEVLISRGNVGILDEFPPTLNAVAKYQGLSTDIVQWD